MRPAPDMPVTTTTRPSPSVRPPPDQRHEDAARHRRRHRWRAEAAANRLRDARHGALGQPLSRPDRQSSSTHRLTCAPRHDGTRKMPLPRSSIKPGAPGAQTCARSPRAFQADQVVGDQAGHRGQQLEQQSGLAAARRRPAAECHGRTRQPPTPWTGAAGREPRTAGRWLTRPGPGRAHAAVPTRLAARARCAGAPDLGSRRIRATARQRLELDGAFAPRAPAAGTRDRRARRRARRSRPGVPSLAKIADELRQSRHARMRNGDTLADAGGPQPLALLDGRRGWSADPRWPTVDARVGKIVKQLPL